MKLKGEVSVPAFAKVNLFLDITGKLPDGYHSLNTVMQQISLCDKVTVRVNEKKGIFVSCDQPSIPCDERNIAFRAAKAFLNETGLNVGIYINIEKKIPVMAGLGGSSADGAAVIIALNKMCSDVLSRDHMERLGRSLGADVPFCIRGGAAVCKGIGDEMESVDGLDEKYGLVVVKPDFSCNTATAYRLYDEKPVSETGDFDGFLRSLKSGDIKKLGDRLYNIFEKLYNNERIERIKVELLTAGAEGTCLTGSGSGVFGIFENKKKAQAAADKLDFPVKFVAAPVMGLEM